VVVVKSCLITETILMALDRVRLIVVQLVQLLLYAGTGGATTESEVQNAVKFGVSRSRLDTMH